jgi:hypothetical protein
LGRNELEANPADEEGTLFSKIMKLSIEGRNIFKERICKMDREEKRRRDI